VNNLLPPGANGRFPIHHTIFANHPAGGGVMVDKLLRIQLKTDAFSIFSYF
jgi:hypothetical protein